MKPPVLFDDKKVDLDELAKAQRPDALPSSFSGIKQIKGGGSGLNYIYKNKWWLTWNGEPVVHIRGKQVSVQCNGNETISRKVRALYYRSYGVPFGVQLIETVYVLQ